MTLDLPLGKDKLLHIEVIGKYEPVGILGKGGQSYVLDARDLHTGEPCAIKVLFGYGSTPEEDDYANAIKRLRSARRAFKEIGPHDHIVRFLDFGDLRIENIIDGREVAVPCYFNVYERVDLRDDGKETHKCLTPRQAARVGAETASALSAMHEKGWVHRDTKPANLLLDKALHVHLGDLGLTYKMNERAGNDGTVEFLPGDPEDPKSEHDTWAATLFGTPAYMSPEQVSNQFVGPKSDIYNLGATLYTMLVGKSPHKGKKPVEVMFSARIDDITPVTTASPDVPQGLNNIVMKMLEKQPEDRGDLRELGADLRGLDADLREREELDLRLATLDSKPVVNLSYARRTWRCAKGAWNFLFGEF